MILKRDIELAITAQSHQLAIKSGIISRLLLEKFKPSGKHIEVISGVRRCGKSTVMKQIINNYQKTAFLNFEDARLHGFEVGDFNKFDEAIGKGIDAYFFDEIQNVASWEIFVRQLHERGEKVYITGSNATLLSSELGSRLTGRHLKHELFPFSFNEFLDYRKLENNVDSFKLYLSLGGFPEYLDTGNQEVLQNMLKDIVFRDIAIRFGIKNTSALLDIALYMLSNIGKEFSFNSIRKAFSLGSANTASDYLTWLGESYLLFYLHKFSWSSKNMSIAPRKVYVIDNGLVNANTLSFSEDRGRLLENAIYLFLRQKYSSLFYFRENRECDFVVFEDRKCKKLIQVCEELNHDNLKREMDGLQEAMKFFGMNEGYILTLDQKDELHQQDTIVHVIPVYEYISSPGS